MHSTSFALVSFSFISSLSIVSCLISLFSLSCLFLSFLLRGPFCLHNRHFRVHVLHFRRHKRRLCLCRRRCRRRLRRKLANLDGACVRILARGGGRGTLVQVLHIFHHVLLHRSLNRTADLAFDERMEDGVQEITRANGGGGGGAGGGGGGGGGGRKKGAKGGGDGDGDSSVPVVPWALLIERMMADPNFADLSRNSEEYFKKLKPADADLVHGELENAPPRMCDEGLMDSTVPDDLRDGLPSFDMPTASMRRRPIPSVATMVKELIAARS